MPPGTPFHLPAASRFSCVVEPGSKSRTCRPAPYLLRIGWRITLWMVQRQCIGERWPRSGATDRDASADHPGRWRSLRTRGSPATTPDHLVDRPDFRRDLRTRAIRPLENRLRRSKFCSGFRPIRAFRLGHVSTAAITCDVPRVSSASHGPLSSVCANVVRRNRSDAES